MERTVLILGSNGRFGRHALSAFTFAGWDVRTFIRGEDDLWDAAWGAEVIVNAWNPIPPEWNDGFFAMHQEVIEVAKASGATVIIPGNVYNFGADMPEVLTENTPHRPTTRYGQFRTKLEAAYRDAGVRTLVLRAGDFIDTQASGNWFDKVIMAKILKGRIEAPGPLNVPHSWAYVPDMAAAAEQLMRDRLSLNMFEDVIFPGHTLTFEDIQGATQEILGRRVALARMPWLPLYAAAPFWPMGRYLLAMRYLWNTPHQMGGTRFAELLPDFEATPLTEVIASAIEDQINPDQSVRTGGITLRTQQV